MSSADVIDALFVKTVDMVQSLPKSGPIQTSYEEELALYSLYKQATEGDVQSKRPGMLDMLGRAKWDAWAKVRGLSPRDAKQMYVESMLRILRRFSHRPQAVSLIEELENFSGQVAQRVMDGSLAHIDSDQESLTDADMSEPQHRLDPTALQQSQSGVSSARPDTFLQPKPPSITGASTAAIRGGVPSSLSPRRTPPAYSHSEGDTSDNDHFGDPPGPFRPVSRNQSSLGNAPQSSVRPHHPAASISGPDGNPRSSLARSHLLSAPSQHSSADLRTRRSQPAQSGHSRPPSVLPTATPSLTASTYPRHNKPLQYQRSTYAASSVGGRSFRTAGGPSTHFPPPSSSNTGAGLWQRPEMEMALQSIQASLAALHERLNRVENSSLSNGSDDARRRRSRATSSASRRLYDAVMNIIADVRQLLGLATGIRSPRSEALAPSFLADSGKDGNRGNVAANLLASPIKILIALINLCARLALDVVSMALVSSIFLYAFKKITGKGDPLLMLRLLKRTQQAILRRAPAAKQLIREVSA